ncbi:MAG: hypothetical protein H0W62_07585 [Chitinophagales bacterium]|nr:hypothetical protein [Chitinophagales bacterium]
MKCLLTILLFLFTGTGVTMAQLNEKNLEGEYDLEGVREVGSGFVLHADHTFDFFFSYGALDRQGNGKWQLTGNQVIFNSEPWPGSDFLLEHHQHSRRCNIAIQIQDKNKMILKYIQCKVISKDRVQAAETDNEGLLIFEPQPIDSILLVHTYFSDQISSFPIDDSTENDFLFTLSPTFGTVFFKDFKLSLNGENLSGLHPIIKEKDMYEYIKNQ